MTDRPKPKRCRFQFSLKTMWVLIAVCAVLLACLSLVWLSERYVHPMLAHDRIIALGGGFSFDNRMGTGIWRGNRGGNPFITEGVVLSQANITDSDLSILDSLRGVTELWLNHTPITDNCVQFLTCLSESQFVDLRGTRVSESAVQRIRSKLPNCKVVTDSTPLAEQAKYPTHYSCISTDCHTLFSNPNGLCPRCGADCSTRTSAEEGS